MDKIALVTDSTSDLTQEMQREFGAHIVRQKIAFGAETFADGELPSVEFFFRLFQAKELPTTMPPALDEFVATYKSLLEKYEEIISIHLTEVLSRTIAVARQAREVLGAQNRIHLVDSGTVSMGTALQVAEAARGIREGLGTKEILASLRQTHSATETMLMLDTIEFLRRGGRIGRLQGMVSSLLNIKPIIRINQDGGFDAAGRARDLDQAMETMVKLLREKAAGRQVVNMGVVHGSAREAGIRLKRALEYAFGAEVNYFTEVGPTVGVHSGPGIIGVSLRFA